MELSKDAIEQRVHAAIRPQLDRCDELLDHYLQDAPREVWEPIAFKVAADHYGKSIFVRLAAEVDHFVRAINETARNMAQVSLHQAFHNPNEPVPPVPVGP